MIARAGTSFDIGGSPGGLPTPRYAGVVLELAQGVFLALLALLAAGPLLMGATRPWAQAIFVAVGGFLGVLVLGKVVAARGQPVRVTWLDGAVWLFVAYVAWQYAAAPAEIVARRELLLVGLYAMVFYAAWRHMPSSKHVRAVAVVIVVLAGLEAAYGVIQHMRGSPYIAFGVPRAAQYEFRAGGTFNCPNHYAGFLEIGLGLALGLLLFSRFGLWLKALLGAAALVMATGILLSVSRGGWLATAGGLMVLAWLGGGRRPGARLKIGILAVVFGAVTAALVAASPFMRSRLDQMLGGNDVRPTLYRDSLKIVRQAPVWGTGPATFQYMHPRIQQPDFPRRARYTHCDYLNLACDYGLVGVGIVGVFFAALGWQLRCVRRRVGRTNDEALWIGSVTSLSMLLIHSAVDFNMHVPSNAACLLAATALPLGLPRRQESALTLAPGFRWAVAAVLVAGLSWYWVKAVRGGMAEALCAMAQRHEEAGDEEFLGLSRRAMAWDPGLDKAAEQAGDYLRVRTARATEPAERARFGAEAIRFFTAARQANPWEVTATVKQAMVCDLLQRRSEAYLLYRKALDLDPHNWRIQGWLGRHYWERGMLERAQEVFGQAARMGNDPELQSALDAVAKLRESKRR